MRIYLLKDSENIHDNAATRGKIMCIVVCAYLGREVAFFCIVYPFFLPFGKATDFPLVNDDSALK